MFQLSVQDIHPGQQAGNKEEAIRQVAAALVSAGNVADGYVNGMLAREQQTSTFLGNGIAIPHGTTDTRDQVLKTGVQVFQLTQGVTWGEGQTAYVAIGIAASSDEHLGLLRQLTHVLSDDAVAAQLQSATTAEELRALLMGEKQSEALKLDNETLSLDVAASDLLTLQALNAARLKEVGAVDAAFVSHVINDTPLNLGQGVWLNDSAEGNLRSAVAVSRAANAFTRDEQPVSLLVTVAMADEQPTAVLNRLSKLLLDKKADHLLKADWLSFTVTSKARNKIRQYLNEEINHQADIGKETLMRRLKNWKIEFNDEVIRKLMQHYKYKFALDLYHGIAIGKHDPSEIKEILTQVEEKPAPVVPPKDIKVVRPKKIDEDVLLIDKNVDNVEYKFARCCNPVYGDDIIGFVSIGEGIKVHRRQCKNALELVRRYPYRIVKTRWTNDGATSYQTVLNLTGKEDGNIINKITELIAKDPHATLRAISINAAEGVFDGNITVLIDNTEHLSQLISRLKHLEGVVRVNRHDSMLED